MNSNTAWALIIATAVFGALGKYAVDNVKVTQTTVHDVEIAKTTAARDLELERLDNEFKSRATTDEITKRKLRCVLDLKNTVTQEWVNANVDAFTALIDSTCR